MNASEVEGYAGLEGSGYIWCTDNFTVALDQMDATLHFQVEAGEACWMFGVRLPSEMERLF